MKVCIRCNPKMVSETYNKLSPQQKQKLSSLGFEDFFKMKTDALVSRELVVWLMDRIDPEKMCIQLDDAGQKVIYFTPRDVHLVFGLPYGGSEVKLQSIQFLNAEMDKIRQHFNIVDKQVQVKGKKDKQWKKGDIKPKTLWTELELGKVDDEFTWRCLFMIISARFLFPTAKYMIGHRDVEFALEPAKLAGVDVSRAVWEAIRQAVIDWRKRKAVANPGVDGCVLFLIVSSAHLADTNITVTILISSADDSLCSDILCGQSCPRGHTGQHTPAPSVFILRQGQTGNCHPSCQESGSAGERLLHRAEGLHPPLVNQK